MVLLERRFAAGLLVIVGVRPVISSFRILRAAGVLRDEVSAFDGGAA